MFSLLSKMREKRNETTKASIMYIVFISALLFQKIVPAYKKITFLKNVYKTGITLVVRILLDYKVLAAMGHTCMV